MAPNADSVRRYPMRYASPAEFPESVQDLGDVLYSLPPQGDRERYIDYAQRLADALEAKGWTLTPSHNGSSES